MVPFLESAQRGGLEHPQPRDDPLEPGRGGTLLIDHSVTLALTARAQTALMSPHVDWRGARRPPSSRAPRRGSQPPPRALRAAPGLRTERRRPPHGAAGGASTCTGSAGRSAPSSARRCSARASRRSRSPSCFGIEPLIDERVIEPTNVFEGRRMSRALMNPLDWRHLSRPEHPQLGRAVRAGRRAHAGGDDRCLGRRRHPATSSSSATSCRSGSPTSRSPACRTRHDPRRRRCALSSVTSFELVGDVWREVGLRRARLDRRRRRRGSRLMLGIRSSALRRAAAVLLAGGTARLARGVHERPAGRSVPRGRQQGLHLGRRRGAGDPGRPSAASPSSSPRRPRTATRSRARTTWAACSS